ncbi:proline/glycine betaine ABC transporter periplasmatic substrate-binding protein [Octadecabacter arcticus 238]|jgi:glycine betaine/proline transport system substrate-binding protein|uniref:Proline/glycine betaine ABC transporter periplasmatic substrate-binding protein n=1 Tax=Octadecabacter arcticus 238 TaxID=391616 RepID=M9RP32_9RHOB|nr:ABC transporter substrate-binding protein [Octadecabacter arcticus]AGI74374.1 proline/glycine betaine ABC transporter periplasmatic substrate-binding protein [Octadecabacter arcticus 238]
MLYIRKIKTALSLGTAVIAMAGAATAVELGATDEPIKLAINEWTGQHISTHIGGELLRAAGYDVEYITAGNYPQHTALADGDIHATLEVWMNNVGDIYPQMKEAGQIVDIGPLGLTTREGWMYPKHMEETCPGLPSWEALVACQAEMITAETFPKGRILGYPADWGTRSADIIESLALEYKAVPAGSEGALVAELRSSIAQKTPLVMMFWAPHWIFSEVDAGWVDLPAYDPACDTDPTWGPNPNATGDCGVEAPVTMKVAWSGFEEKWPAAWEILSALQIDTAQQEAMMKAIDQDGEAIEDVVAAWIDENKDTWTPWVETATQ